MTVVEEGAELLGVAEFADKVLGRALWDHQLELLRSTARYRIICAGRQSGKSSSLVTAALHRAVTRRNQLVLLVSAGEIASRRLLEDCAHIAESSPLMRGSTLDVSRSELVLSNGSRILSVPASEKQIRGWPVDLLIIDEAGFVSQDIWRAAEPAIIARPGSQVILSSSPWGGPDHFFRSLWARGMDRPDAQVAAWHWPSSISPLVDAALLEQIREREAADYFQREFLAVWADAAGSYFTEAELMAAAADYAMTAPEDLPSLPWGEPGFPVAAGIDWGISDANAVALVGIMGRPTDGRARLFVPWIEGRSGWPFTEFIGRIVEIAEGYWVRVAASERNGIGEFPTTELKDRLWRRRTDTFVSPVWTDARRKMSGFGRIKGLLQSDRLVLPMHPPLLKELRSLEFEQLAGGGLRIAVPERSGHDDLSMALMQAVSCFDVSMMQDGEGLFGINNPDQYVTTGAGVLVPQRPFPDRDRIAAIRSPGGKDKSDGW